MEKFRRFMPVIVLVAALALRLVNLWMEPTTSRDGIAYVELAAEWGEGGGYYEHAKKLSNPPPPLFIYLLKCAMKAGLPGDGFGKAVNIAAGTLLVLAIYLLALEFSSFPIAISAMAIAAINPLLITLSIQPQREILYLLGMSAAFLCILHGIKRETGLWIAGGAFAAVAFLTRKEALELPLVICVFMAVATISGQLKIKLALRYAAYFLAGFLATAVVLCLLMGVSWEFFALIFEQAGRLLRKVTV